MDVNRWLVTAEQEETNPNHGEEDTDGAKDGLCWGDARDLLGKIESFDGRVQHREGTIAPFLSLGVCSHR